MKNFEITAYRIALEFDFESKQIKAIAKISITPQIPIQSLRFQSPPVHNVSGSVELSHEQDSELVIFLKDQLDPFWITISYSLDFQYAKEQVILHSYQSIAKWLPTTDEKCSFDIQITTPCVLDGKELVALCSGEILGNVVHPDPSKRIFCYSNKIPIAANSIVISIGPYESVKFSHFKPQVKTDEEEYVEQQQNSRITVFYLPNCKNFIQPSCFYLPQALEFVEQWVGGSFPFDELKIVFSDQTHTPIVSGATIIVANVNLLLQDSVIDHVFTNRFELCTAVAHQWFGHYIASQSWDDTWIIIGFSRWIAYMFLKKIHGNNEFKFRIKKDMERLCLIDVKQPPLCPMNVPKTRNDVLVGQLFEVWDDPESVRGELVSIKSALVLNMMEKRFGKGLLSKLAGKIMMSQMSGELTAGLSTVDFLKLARKVSGKLEIKEFADQWIFGSGVPIFTTSYNFNRKKMVIELKICQRSSNEGMVGATAKFTGPMTIRVQEPGGTFDTEVRIEEYQKQYDIIYHTKYKRIRRNAVKKKKSGGLFEDEEEEEEEEEQEEGVLDIAEPDRITFEWIRLDPDCVWCCHLTFEQDDFMWNSVMRQNKDVNAQYEV
jgi:hypothetical protein